MNKKYHEDMFLWKTINNVVPHISEEKKEEIYNQLFLKTWRISQIEDLAYRS